MTKKRRRTSPQKANRFDKAYMLVELDAVKSLRTDKTNRIINALVPGSEAKTYEVIARREGRNYIETECLLQLGANGTQDCKGGWSSVCYHALAVLLTSARDNGQETAVCASEQDANRRKNIGGKVFAVKSKHAPQNPLWIVANPIHPTDTPDPIEEPKQEKLPEKRTAEQIAKELGY